jgi:hypothetical protein
MVQRNLRPFFGLIFFEINDELRFLDSKCLSLRGTFRCARFDFLKIRHLKGVSLPLEMNYEREIPFAGDG